MDRRCFRPADPPPREAERLEALHRCEVLDTGPEPAFDDLTALASRAAGTPIALVSLIDEHRQWFKSRHGLEAHETPRDWAFCAHAIHGRDLMEVPDAARDARFAGNPLVVGAPHIRYYAGTPLVTPEGHALGTLCVIDRRPRRLSRAARDTLARLARQGAQLLELRLAQRRRAEVETRLRAQSAELSRMALVAQHTRHAAVLLDREGRIEWANRGFERTTGYTLDEARGRTVGELLSCAETDAATLERLRRAVREGTTARACIVNRRRDGTRFWSDVDLQPLTDEAGTPTGFVVMRTDVTALVQEREAAQAMLSALPVGVLVRDADAAIVEANPAAERIFGLPREQILSRELLERDLPTTDAAGRPVPRADRPAIRTLATGEALHDVPLTIRAADGALRHLTASIAPLHHADGRVAGVVTCLLDVTREREQQRLMAIAAGAAHFVPWWLNVQTWQVEFEVRPAAALGFVRADAGGEGGIARIAWWPTVHRDDAPVARAAIQRHLRGEDDRFRAEYRIRDAAGGWRWVQMSGSVTERDADGRPLWVAGLSRDIEERKRAEAALERAATRDELTGLPNRAVLRDRLRQAIAAAGRRRGAGRRAAVHRPRPLQARQRQPGPRRG
jgi:PAS domain S-box-containing protein